MAPDEHQAARGADPHFDRAGAEVATATGTRRPSAHPATLLIGLVLMGTVLGALVLGARPPAAKGIDAPADVFAAGRAMDTLRRVLGDGGAPRSGPGPTRG